MTVTAARQAAPAAAIALFATLVAAYVLSQFLRNSIGVIAPDIAAEMHIAASEIGVLSSAFFFAFAAVQLPLGVAIDRFGPKRCMLACAAVVIASALLFAAGRTPAELVAARVVMGVGTSCFLVAPLALYAQRFAPDRFAMLAGLHMGVGTLGTLLATAPLAFTAAAIGWRAAFVAVAAVMGVVGLLIALVVREPPPARGAEGGRRETLAQSILGIRAAMRIPSVGRLFVMQMATYSSFVIFVGLWGGPYLTHVNMGSMGGVFVTQTVSGLAIDLFASTDGVYPLAAYRLVFGLQAAFLVGAAALYLTARDPLRDSRRPDRRRA